MRATLRLFDKREYMREVEAIVRSLVWYEAPTPTLRHEECWFAGGVGGARRLRAGVHARAMGV